MRRRSSLSSRSNFRCSTSSTARPVQLAHHRLAALMPARRPSRYIAAATINAKAQPLYNSTRRTESDTIAPRVLEMPAQWNQPVLLRRGLGAFPGRPRRTSAIPAVNARRRVLAAAYVRHAPASPRGRPHRLPRLANTPRSRREGRLASTALLCRQGHQTSSLFASRPPFAPSDDYYGCHRNDARTTSSRR
jgi:hypothetical protein